MTRALLIGDAPGVDLGYSYVREAPYDAVVSFFMAIPIMLGASGLKIVKFILAGFTVDTEELLILLVGITVAFIVSLSVIRFLMEFVKRHDFTVFGYYRIGIGIIIILYFLVKQSV